MSTPEKAQEVLEKIADDQYAIVYITEQLAEKIVSTIDEYSERRFPAIIPIPSNAGSLGIGLQGIKKAWNVQLVQIYYLKTNKLTDKILMKEGMRD